jgi:hypothetical protein
MSDRQDDDPPRRRERHPAPAIRTRGYYWACVAIAIVAILCLSAFIDAFVAWNKEQACATAGRRNCAGPPTYLQH